MEAGFCTAASIERKASELCHEIRRIVVQDELLLLGGSCGRSRSYRLCHEFHHLFHVHLRRSRRSGTRARGAIWWGSHNIVVLRRLKTHREVLSSCLSVVLLSRWFCCFRCFRSFRCFRCFVKPLVRCFTDVFVRCYINRSLPIVSPLRIGRILM